MMKTRFGSAVFFAIATVTTVVLAQSNPVPPTQQPTTQAPPTAAPSPPASATVSQDKDHQITLTGCLENAPAATAGTSAPEPVKRLVLTNAISAADSAAKTATAPGSPAGRTYQVIANEAALSPYIGKKVELTGTVEVPVPPTASSTPAPGAEGTSAAAMLPRLRVESGKALPTSCTS
jgi:hypothetical protein